jgi:GntR family galactonate operon transcriptional repressor
MHGGSSVRPRGLHAQVVRSIGIQIVSGVLRPGDVLPEQLELGRRLGVSRTVVREATKVLSEKGLVESRPRRGTVVLPRARWRLIDRDVLAWQEESGPNRLFLRNVFEVRAIIEPAAARLAARRATPGEIKVIDAGFRGMNSAVGEASYLTADLAFHEAIMSSTHNDQLIQIVATFTAALHVCLVATVPDQGSWQDFMDFSLPLHRDVLEGVRNGDPSSAEASMTRLVEASRLQTIGEALIDDPGRM